MQTTRSSFGRSSLGNNVKELGSNGVAHQGQLSSGMGAGRPLGLALNCRVLARAESGRLSPLRPIQFGVAALPTQSPISNGQVP